MRGSLIIKKSNPMTKNDIVKKVTILDGIDRELAEKAVNVMINSIKESLVNGESLFLRGFGTLQVVTRKAKQVRNIKAGTSFTMPAWKKPVFKPSKSFVNEINKDNI